MTWDLSVFYKGFDDPQIREDINTVKSMLEGVEEMMGKEESAKEKLEAIIRFEEKSGTLLNRIMMFGHLTLAADNTNKEALRLMDEMGMLMVDVKLADSRFGRYVGSIDNLEEVIASSEKLMAHGFYLREEAEHARHMVPAEMEKSLLQMSLNGGDAWAKLKDRLMGTLTCELNGKSYPLPAVRGMAYDPDPAVRKAAYEAELASYKKVETAMAYCLGCIKGETMTL